MNTITELFSSAWVQALGWTLLHSLWQSLLCVVVVTIVLRGVPSRLSAIRYAIATAGLFLILLTSAGTFLYLNDAAFSTANEIGPSIHQTIPHSTTNVFQYPSFNGLLTAIRSQIQSSIPSIVLIWSVGTLLFALRLFGGWWYIKKLRENATQLENEWSERVQQLARQLSIDQFITLAECARIQAPIVIGYIKPMILIPIGMSSGLSTEQIESIFIHELIHIRRGDYFVNMIQSFLEALFFFNPFVWIVSGIMRREREHCCDDAVVTFYGNPLAYAHALTTLEAVRLSKPPLALSLAENKNQLLNRIKRIMEKSVRSYSGRERIVPVVLLVLGLVCASWLTIQNEKSSQDLALQSVPLNNAKLASDTTIKGKSARYSRRKVTTMGEDGSPKEEIIEEFEGDEDLRPMMSGMNFDFEIPPIPEITEMVEMVPPMEDFVIAIPPVPGMDFEFAIPPLEAIPNFHDQFPGNFMLDTIPGHEFGDRNWDEFGTEFEKNFKERFGDFYEKHEEELKKMMEEVEEKIKYRNDEAWDEKMESIADEQAQLAELQEIRARQNEIALAEHEKYAERMALKMKSWEDQNAIHIRELEKNMKIMEESTKVFEKKLRDQLVKDGYIGAGENINSIHIHSTDDTIEINGKKIKAADEKKYKEMIQENAHRLKEIKQRFSDIQKGRKE